MFNVLSKQCNQCLYGPNKIVGNETRRQLIRDIEAKDTYFVCHKASIAGVEAACHEDLERRGCGQLGRIAGRLNMVNFVDEADLKTLPEAPPRVNDSEDWEDEE